MKKALLFLAPCLFLSLAGCNPEEEPTTDPSGKKLVSQLRITDETLDPDATADRIVTLSYFPDGRLSNVKDYTKSSYIESGVQIEQEEERNHAIQIEGNTLTVSTNYRKKLLNADYEYKTSSSGAFEINNQGFISSIPMDPRENNGNGTTRTFSYNQQGQLISYFLDYDWYQSTYEYTWADGNMVSILVDNSSRHFSYSPDENLCNMDLGAFAFADNSLPIPWYLSLFGYMGNINKNILADGATYAYHIQCDFDKNGYVTRIRKYHPTSHKLQETIEISYK